MRRVDLEWMHSGLGRSMAPSRGARRVAMGPAMSELASATSITETTPTE
jgi:hypothetical protein